MQQSLPLTALSAMSGNAAVTPVLRVLPVIVAFAFAWLTCITWSRLQLDR